MEALEVSDEVTKVELTSAIDDCTEGWGLDAGGVAVVAGGTTEVVGAGAAAVVGAMAVVSLAIYF